MVNAKRLSASSRVRAYVTIAATSSAARLTPTDAILLVVAQEPDTTIRGRTLLQKKLYFLSVLCDLDYGFSPHFYGPYSSPISGEIATLLAVGFLEESSRSFAETLGR